MECGVKFPDLGANIMADLRTDVWTEYMPLPKDEQDYVAMGLF